MLADHRHLFAKMRVMAENDGLQGRPAEALLSLLPIHSAPPGTELAVLEDRIGLLDPLGQLTFLLQFCVSWLPPCFLRGGLSQGRRKKKGTPCEEKRSFYENAACDLHVITRRVDSRLYLLRNDVKNQKEEYPEQFLCC
jgi:hypothetical protein